MSSNLYIKPFANPQYREDLDGKTIDILYDSWWEKGEDLGEVSYEYFWGSIWKAFGLVSLEEWLGTPIEKLAEGTLRVEQVLPSILSKGTKAFDMGCDWHFDAVKKGGFLPEYEEYLASTETHPFRVWETFLDKVIHECHRHSDWYIYLD